MIRANILVTKVTRISVHLMEVSKKMDLKLGIDYFTANFRPNGRKMRKSFILESFLKIFEKFLRPDTLEEGGRRRKLLNIF